VTSAFAREPAAGVLRDLRAYAEVEDARARERVRARSTELGGRVGTAEKYVLYGEAPPLAVSPEVGELLYLLARARRPGFVVEFGASHGVSTIYLASALCDNGAGALVTTELLPGKAAATLRNVAEARLDDVVELRAGDALETLRDLRGPIELLFLDGRNDLYLPVLRLLEPELAPSALVVADLSPDDPDLATYLEHVRGPDGRYDSLSVACGAGVEVSVLRG
jgi:predicted O-methyltransferase YrrM